MEDNYDIVGDPTKLNKFKLIDEAERQASSMSYNCEKLGNYDVDIADLKLVISKEKKKLDVKKAKLELKIRSGRSKDFANYKGKTPQSDDSVPIKITDKAILAYIIADDSIDACEDAINDKHAEFNDKTRERNKVAAVVEGLRQKIKMIEMLWDAALKEWYSMPRLDNKREIQEEKNKEFLDMQLDKARNRRENRRENRRKQDD